MATDASDWASGVLPHGALEQLAPNVWIVEGSLSNMPLKRNMVVIRLPDGKLVLHSVVAIDEATVAKLEALGTPAVMIVPSEGHRLDTLRYKKRWPGIVVVSPKNAKAKVEEVVPVDATAEEYLPPLGIEILKPQGTKDGYELVYLVPIDGGGKAMVINDVLGNGVAPKGLGQWAFSFLGAPGGGFGLPRIVRFFFVNDKAAYKAWLQGTLAKVPDVKVLTVSHGPPLTSGVSEAIAAAAARI
jgi:hypothetical protein